MNLAEERKIELEVLQSIFDGDERFKVIDENKFQVSTWFLRYTYLNICKNEYCALLVILLLGIENKSISLFSYCHDRFSIVLAGNLRKFRYIKVTVSFFQVM